MKIKTYCPIFSGFYEGLFDLCTEDFCEENDCNYDDLEIDYSGYQNEISKAICIEVSNYLADYVHSITFESLRSPRFYNFENDSINCLIDPNKDAIKEYIYENKEAFEKYLRENYSSCDGFISSYSNLFIDWTEDTKDFSNFSNDAHKLGSILQFISENEGISEGDIYHDVMDHIDEYEYIKIKQDEQ